MTVYLYPWVLDSMDEYSCTLPTATTIGKVWKRRVPEDALPNDAKWHVGMYVEHSDPKRVKILWFDVELLSGPAPRAYSPPDWSNFDAWKAELDLERAERAAGVGAP
jgi:hypothetical protein